ncbi:MAG: hypothetical protein RL030_2769 [Pseudomonadota bacterium]
MDSRARAEQVRLTTRLDSLERQLNNIPSRIGSPEPDYLIVIVGGNTLSSGQNGIKHVTTQTEVPSDYDPDVDTSYADGWGNAYLYVDGVLQDKKVLVLNDGGLSTLVESWELTSPGPSYLPLAGGGGQFVTFYRGTDL